MSSRDPEQQESSGRGCDGGQRVRSASLFEMRRLRSLNGQEQRALQLAGSSVPVLMARQLTYCQHGHPLELTDQAYRGDRYQFRATIA